MDNTLQTLLIPVIGTTLGAAAVFLVRDKMPHRAERGMLGFASGVMVAASIWSLLIPAIDIEAGLGMWASLPAALGLALGMGFLLLIDTVTPHLHSGSKSPEGPASHLSRVQMLALAVAIHNLPEGMAVGIVSADVADLSASAPLAVSLGVAIQNIPEGAIISMPLLASGLGRFKAFGVGALSGLVEPVGAVLVILLAGAVQGIMPYMLGFAAGAMLYVVFEDLVPQASSGGHSNVPVVSFGVGFVLMMLMDTVLG